MVLRKAYLIVAQMKELVDVERIKMLLSYVMVYDSNLRMLCLIVMDAKP